MLCVGKWQILAKWQISACWEKWLSEWTEIAKVDIDGLIRGGGHCISGHCPLFHCPPVRFLPSLSPHCCNMSTHEILQQCPLLQFQPSPPSCPPRKFSRVSLESKRQRPMYTLSGTMCRYICASNFAKYCPIFKILSPIYIGTKYYLDYFDSFPNPK